MDKDVHHCGVECVRSQLKSFFFGSGCFCRLFFPVASLQGDEYSGDKQTSSNMLIVAAASWSTKHKRDVGSSVLEKNRERGRSRNCSDFSPLTLTRGTGDHIISLFLVLAVSDWPIRELSKSPPTTTWVEQTLCLNGRKASKIGDRGRWGGGVT